MSTSTLTSIYLSIYLSVHVCLHMYVCACAFARARVCVCRFVYSSVHASYNLPTLFSSAKLNRCVYISVV